MTISGEEIAEIEAACEAIKDQTWEKPERRFEVIIPNDGPGLVVAGVTSHDAGIHIANMDPATTLKFLSERKELGLEIERLIGLAADRQIEIDNLKLRDSTARERARIQETRAENAEANFNTLHDELAAVQESERQARGEIERLERDGIEDLAAVAHVTGDTIDRLQARVESLENELAQWKPDEKYEAEDARIIAELEAMSEEELDEQLRAVGIDPDEAMRRVTAVVKACKRMTEERDRADAAEKELAEIKATRIGQIISDNEILKDLSEGAVLQRDEARKALAEMMVLATDEYCKSCGEIHPPESMCPPFEVRTTGSQWALERIKYIEGKLRAILDTGKKDK